MIYCIVAGCSWKSSEVDRLYNHLNRYHDTLEVYRCNYGTCTRRFSIRSTFFRHLKDHVKNEPVQLNLINNDREHENNPVPGTSSHDEPASTAEVPVQTINESNTVSSIIQQFNNISFNCNHLTLKWLNLNSMPRNCVFNIQCDIQDQILKPLDKVFTSLQQSGCLSEEVRRFLSNSLNVFDESQTEYTFQKKMKEAGLYEAPQDFIVAQSSSHNDDNYPTNTIKG